MTRACLESLQPEIRVSSSLYHGSLDMSCLAATTDVLETRRLKIAVVFDDEAFRFGIWLSAAYKALQKKWGTLSDRWESNPRLQLGRLG